MTVFRQPRSAIYRFDFWFRKQRYVGSTGERSEEAAKAFEEVVKRELRMEAAGLIPHRLLKGVDRRHTETIDGAVHVVSEAGARIYAEHARDLYAGLLMMPARGVIGTVYFIGHRTDGPVKIGYTAAGRLRQRLAGIQTGNPTELDVLLQIPGTVHTERRLHEAFAESRLEGEWFTRDARLIAFIDAVATGGNSGGSQIQTTSETLNISQADAAE